MARNTRIEAAAFPIALHSPLHPCIPCNPWFPSSFERLVFAGAKPDRPFPFDCLCHRVFRGGAAEAEIRALMVVQIVSINELER